MEPPWEAPALPLLACLPLGTAGITAGALALHQQATDSVCSGNPALQPVSASSQRRRPDSQHCRLTRSCHAIQQAHHPQSTSFAVMPHGARTSSCAEVACQSPHLAIPAPLLWLSCSGSCCCWRRPKLVLLVARAVLRGVSYLWRRLTSSEPLQRPDTLSARCPSCSGAPAINRRFTCARGHTQPCTCPTMCRHTKMCVIEFCEG